MKNRDVDKDDIKAIIASLKKDYYNYKAKFLDFMSDDKKRKLMIVLFMALSVVLRVIFTILKNSIDQTLFLTPWVEAYSKLSFKEAMNSNITNYNIPYNIILFAISKLPGKSGWWISLVSCIFDYLMLYFVYKVIIYIKENGVFFSTKKEDDSKTQGEKTTILDNKKLSKFDKELFFFFTVLLSFLPFIIYDSAIWKQCDSIYACFIVISVYYFLKKKHFLSFLFLGISLAFKLQAIFIFPAYAIILFMINKKALFGFLLTPIIFLLFDLPGLLVMNNFKDALSIYKTQVNYYSSLEMGYPDIFAILPDINQLRTPAIILTFVLLFALFIFVLIKKPDFNINFTLLFIGWTIFTIVFFLPSMHERYDYTYVMLLSIYYIFIECRPKLITAINFISLCSYGSFLLMFTLPLRLLFIFNLICYIYVTKDVFNYINNHNKTQKGG
ncbi:MAG: hypothetical protein K6F77_09315 [Lachnospiraceae bacterium]|nr:hypothetical protein [Lachnospiraceae bacterium]